MRPERPRPLFDKPADQGAMPSEKEGEREKYYSEQLLGDIEAVYSRPTNATERSKQEKAKRRLRQNQVILSALDDERRRSNVDMLLDAISIIEGGQQVVDNLRATWDRDSKLLEKAGVDVSLLLKAKGVVLSSKEEQEAREVSKNGESLKPMYEVDFQEALKITEGDPESRRREIDGWRRKYKKANIPVGFLVNTVNVVSLQTRKEIEKSRAELKAGVSAFGRSEEQLSQLGVEERAQRRDPIIVELERPILGHKIPFEYGSSFFGGMRMERRAFKEEEAFSPERVKLLLASTWTEALRIYSGEVNSETKADFSSLSQMEQILKTRIAEIQHTYDLAMKEGKPPLGDEKAKVFFASLIPSTDNRDVLGLNSVFEEIRTGGFRALPEDSKKLIPELKALKDMKKILDWHEAQSQLLRTLQSMRSFSVGKKIDSLAALGDQADKPLLPTSAILRIWDLGELRENPEMKVEKISKYTEEAMRIYRLIYEVGSKTDFKFDSNGEVVFEDAEDRIKFLKGLVWKHLMGEDRIIEGGYRKDVKFILNRFGPNLNVERLAQVEAFVEYLIEKGAWDSFKLDGADFDVELGKYIGAAKKRVTSGEEEPEIKEPNEANKRIEARLGCANAVAVIHVTGLADSWAKHIEWSAYSFLKDVEGEERPGMEKKITKARADTTKVGAKVWNVGDEPSEDDRFPVIKVGGYPACSALSELINFVDKIEGDIGLGNSVGPKTLEAAIRDKNGKRKETGGIRWIPDSLAKNFLEFTVLTDNSGKLISIGKYWAEGKKIDELAGMMANQLAANAHGAWLGSLKASNKIRALLTATDSENYGNMFKNDQLPADLFQSLFSGLGYAFNKDMKRQAAYMRGVIYAGLLAYNTGLTRQLSSAEVNKRLLELRGGTPTATREIEYFIAKLISDSLVGENSGGKVIKPKNGAVTSEGFVVFRELVEEQYMKLTNKRLTQGGLHPAVIIDQPGGIPYAKIWNNPIGTDGKPATYPSGGLVYSLDSTI